MATRTSIYLRDDLETEIKDRAIRRLGSDDTTSLGHVISRHLNVLFAGYKLCRNRVAEKLVYEEMRFLLSVIESEGWDEDDLDTNLELPNHVHMHWMDMQDDASRMPTDEVADAHSKDADWLYWEKIDPDVLAEKIETMHIFDVMALVDGIKTILASDKRDREIIRLFKGIKRPT